MPKEPSPFNVREAQMDDAARLAVLAAQVWTHTYATDGISDVIADYVLRELNPAHYQRVLSDPSNHVLVAEQGALLLGFAVVAFGSGCTVDGASDTELKTLYVQEHFTGQGVGHLLLQVAQATARERNNSVLWLTVDATNDRAMAFYTRQGYRKIGTSFFVLGQHDYENHVLLGAALTETVAA